jgi:autotransporter translocation and assembly factor TamB
LRSEPALSDNEILALLLFGSPEGMLGSGRAGDGGKAAAATSLGGGVATQGLNKALSGLTDADVSTRIDTSDSTGPRPEVAVQVSARVTAAVGYKVADPAPGKAPDRTLFTVDFRLSRRWSLATTFGDRGSSVLELLWRYRY